MRKLILVVMFLTFSCVFVFAQESVQEKQEGVSISYDRLVSYMQVMGEDGKWGPPEEKVSFAEDYGKNFAITAKADGKELKCPVAWQDVAYFLGDDSKKEGKLAIFGYKGCPFAIEGELEPVKNIEMRSEIKIEIGSASGNILWISPTSARPFANTGRQLASGCEMLRNVVWVFKDKGITFETKTAKYLVERPGATIRFTKNGIVMDGVRKTNK
jgi:hypothetical protein